MHKGFSSTIILAVFLLVGVLVVSAIFASQNKIPLSPNITPVANETTNIYPAQNSGITSTSKPASTITPTPNSMTYVNERLGFSLEFTSAWQGFKVTDSGMNIVIEIPYTPDIPDSADQSVYRGKPYPWFAPFYIQVYTLSGWEERQHAPPVLPQFIAQNSENVFTYIKNEPPESLKNINFEIPKVIASFRFTK